MVGEPQQPAVDLQLREGAGQAALADDEGHWIPQLAVCLGYAVKGAGVTEGQQCQQGLAGEVQHRSSSSRVLHLGHTLATHRYCRMNGC